MSHLTRGRTRLVALGAAAALGASTLALAAPAAQAADTTVEGTTLAWGVSRYLNEHLTAQEFTGGATEGASGIVTFRGGTGTVDATAKTVSVEYEGTASYGFAAAGPALYGVSISDPTVIVDGGGAGRIVADVAWFGSAVTAGSADDVTVTTFSGAGATWNRSHILGTPDWAGVVSADSYGDGKPVNGESWAKSFVDVLPASVRATFYSSGTNPKSDAKKFPASFSAQVGPAPAVQATVVAASPADGIDLRIVGTNFSPDTKPGDQGVYVGVAPTDAVIDFGDRNAGTASMVNVDWVLPNQFVDGSFTKYLNLPASKLVKTKQYAVYTWQAHGYSNSSQDTVTPIAIDWSHLTPAKPAPAKAKPSITVKVTKAPTTRKAGRAAIVVKGKRGVATGKVRVQVLKGKKVVKNLGQKKLRKGKVVVALPKRPKGTYKVKVTYTGNTKYKAAAKAKAFKVRKR